MEQAWPRECIPGLVSRARATPALGCVVVNKEVGGFPF